MRNWIKSVGVLAAMAIVTTGCSVGNGAASMPPPASSSAVVASVAASTTPSRPYLTVTPTLELNDRTTKPGTKLKFGQQAVVPFYSHYDKGLVGITVTVDSAPALDEDIDNLPLKDDDKAQLRGKTFFFVRITMVNLDGVNLGDIWPPTLTATTRSGGWPGTLLGVASMDVTECDGVSPAPKDFSVAGAVFEQCRLYFGVSSDPIASMAYTDQPYERTASRALTWRR